MHAKFAVHCLKNQLCSSFIFRVNESAHILAWELLHTYILTVLPIKLGTWYLQRKLGKRMIISFCIARIHLLFLSSLHSCRGIIHPKTMRSDDRCMPTKLRSRSTIAELSHYVQAYVAKFAIVYMLIIPSHYNWHHFLRLLLSVLFGLYCVSDTVFFSVTLGSSLILSFPTKA